MQIMKLTHTHTHHPLLIKALENTPSLGNGRRWCVLLRLVSSLYACLVLSKPIQSQMVDLDVCVSVCTSVSVHLVRDRLSSTAERCAKQMDNTDHLGAAILKPASGIRFFFFLSFSFSPSLSPRPGKPPKPRLLFCGSSFAAILPFFTCHARLLVPALIIFTAVAFN